MQFVFLLLWLVATVVAWWRGGVAERLVALIYALGGAGTLLASQRQFVGIDLGIFGVDTLVLFALIAVTVRFNKQWLIWSSALQLVMVSAHIARFTGGSATPFGYAWIVSVLAYPMLILLMIATWLHYRRARANAI